MPEQLLLTGAVFLSYASQDSEAAGRICDALRAAGVEVWFDKSELRGGDAWDSQIKKQIHDCALFLPIISAHTNARIEGYFRGEWTLATRRLVNRAHNAAFLVPVVVDETREADASVPEEFLRAQWTRLPGGETPAAFTKRVRQLLGLDSVHVPTVKLTATGAIEPSTQNLSSVRPRGTPLVRRFAIPVIALLLVLVGAAFWYFQGASDAPAAKPALSAASPDTPVAPNDKSIAVLPFADMSAEKNQEYMADGIAEELLNLLAQAPDLKVIARTSSFAFKGQNIEVSEIAKRLNVAHVLEGSVRTSGNQVRITAQLVRAADSTHLWSEKYDRPLSDIFAVQDEIANAIVQALQIQLAGGELNRRKGGTQNLEAYRLYLRATSTFYTNTQSSLDACGEYLEQAIEVDPNYGNAWSLLAETVLLRTDSGWLDAREGYERTRQLAQHALRLSPELGHAHALLQYVYRTSDWDWAAAEREGHQALAIDPTNPAVLMYSGMLYRTLGRWDEAERTYRAALARDPLNTYVIWDLATTYYGASRFAEAEATYRHLLELAPNFYWTRPYLAKTLLAQGKAGAALAILQAESDEGARLKYLPAVLQAAGRQAEADEALRAQIAHWAGTGAYWVAQNYAYRGEHDLALEWLQRAYQQKDPVLVEIVGEHLFKGLYDDPQYKSFLRKLRLPEPGKAT